MTLRARLNLIFLGAVVAFGIAGGSAFLAMASLEEALETEARSRKCQQAAQELRSLILRLTQEVGPFLERDPVARRNYEELQARAHTLVEEIRRYALADEERALAEGLEQDVRRYKLVADRADYLAKEGRDDAARDRMARWIRKEMIPEVAQKVEQLVSSQNDRVEAAGLAARRGQQRMEVAIIGSGIGLIGLAALAYFVLRARLVRPLESLGEATRRISRGDYERQIHPGPEDEIGELAREVESMRKSIVTFQRELVDKERLAAVGEMTAAVAHNVRNPLASIRALAQSCQREPGIAPQLHEALGTLIETVDRVDRWLKDLLVALKPIKVAKAPTDLNEVVEDLRATTELFARRRNLSFEVDLDPSLPQVPVDRQKIGQALLAIVTNALEASPSGEVVTLRTRRVRGENGADSRVEVIIADRGHGMDEATQGKIFDAYFSTKRSGTGVGLNLTRRIVYGHEGQIRVESAPGHGCTMRVSLPISNSTTDGES